MVQQCCFYWPVIGWAYSRSWMGLKQVAGTIWDPRPMERLLLGMGACSMYDIVSIIKKSKQQLISYEAKITAKRAEDYPKVFTDIYIYFTLCSENLKISTVKRAIELSSTKYCSAVYYAGKYC